MDKACMAFLYFLIELLSLLFLFMYSINIFYIYKNSIIYDILKYLLECPI